VISPPAGHVIGGVSGAANGSAFVLDMPSKKPGDFSAGQFFMYRPATPGSLPVRLKALNLQPSPAGETILGVALSPDGSRLAVYSMLSYEQVLRVYSVATGRVQGQWTMPSPSHVGSGPGDNSHMLTWTDNGRSVAFRRDIDLAGGEFGVSVYILDVTRPGHDLRADSRIVSVQSNDNGCKSMLVTPDGKTIVCGVESWGGASASCPSVRPGSLSTPPRPASWSASCMGTEAPVPGGWCISTGPTSPARPLSSACSWGPRSGRPSTSPISSAPTVTPACRCTSRPRSSS